MIDAFSPVALAQLIAHEAGHHAAHPLFSDDGVLGSLEAVCVFVVDALKGWRDLGLVCQEGG